MDFSMYFFLPQILAEAAENFQWVALYTDRIQNLYYVMPCTSAPDVITLVVYKQLFF